jgi:hypothetical protein
MTANACDFLRFRMTARVRDWAFVLVPKLPGMQIASVAPYCSNREQFPSGTAVFLLSRKLHDFWENVLGIK